jgi:hypothetical protein
MNTDFFFGARLYEPQCVDALMRFDFRLQVWLVGVAVGRRPALRNPCLSVSIRG